MTTIEKFLPLIFEEEEEQEEREDDTPCPIVSTEEGVSFLYIRHNNLYSNSHK